MQDVRNFFDGYADAFDDIYESGLKRSRYSLSGLLRRSMRRRFELTFALCRPLAGASLLDLGCGSGQYAIYAGLEGARVTGVDFAPEMLAIAERRARELGIAERCTFKLGDITTQSMEKHDYAIALGVFDYVPDAAALLARMRELATRRIVASFPKRWHPLTPQRKLRYRLRNCPLYMYSSADLERLAAGLRPWVPEVLDLGRDYLLTAGAP